jgi:sterol desaturase/sphingolipid hydroxylase (fatty acid hydroxylase superfamily)
MNNVQAIAVAVIFLFFAVIELWRGRFFAQEATREDKRLDVVVFAVFPVVIVPCILLACQWIGLQYFPEYRAALAHWPWWAMAITLLLADDMTQYWWHRLSHSSWMWPFHRAHHSAAYMGVRVVYRNNFFYYAAMPGLWLSGVLIYLGFGWAYVVYSIIKMAVIVGAHSEARWDEALYRNRWLHPLAWVARAHDFHPLHPLCSPRAASRRWNRPLPRQLRQSAVFLGRAVRHGFDHAQISARIWSAG